MSLQSGKLHDGSSDNELLFNIIDPDLDSRIKSIRRAESELEEIFNDPYLEQTRNEVAALMKSRDKKVTSGEKSDFVRNVISDDSKKAKVIKDLNEIKDIKIEISKSDISDISADWVREWHKKKQMQAIPSAAEADRKNFIASSLNSSLPSDNPEIKVNPEKTITSVTVKKSGKKLWRYSTLAAAAFLGIFITLKTLIPADSEKIYQSFYDPYPAVSPVTRGINDIGPAKDYRDALENYRNGNFIEAESGFRAALISFPPGNDATFYLGLSQMETAKLDEAIINLSSVTDTPGNFAKEARWYLGLAYLKKGDRIKAKECFKVLSSTEGYYSDPSGKILRRLK